MVYLGPIFPHKFYYFFILSIADSKIFWEVLFFVTTKTPVCVKSLAQGKGLIIFIIPPCLPYFVLEVLTKKEPRKPRSDNSKAEGHQEKFDNGRKDDVFTLFLQHFE